MPNGLKVSERGGNIGPARAPALSSLVIGEHRLNDGTDDVHQRGPKDPAKGDGKLKWALTRGGVSTFFLRDPDAEIFVGPEDFDARGHAQRSGVKGLANKESGKGDPMMVNLT